MATTTTKPKKRIILVGGDKGGVGKSANARALADYLDEHGIPYIAYDGDDVNPTFTRFYPNAVRLYTKTVKGFEPLINNLESETPYQLVDLGGGTSIMLGKFAEQTGFFDLSAEHGAAVTFVFILAPNVDSINLLKIISSKYTGFKYVIARSEAVPGNWDLWEGSNTRKALLAAEAIEISIPTLDPDAFALADRNNLKWRDAAKSKLLPLAQRGFMHTWLNKTHLEFDKAKDALLR